MPLASHNSVSSQLSNTSLWNAQNTLQITSNCCVGHAYSKGRTCRIRLAAHNVHKGDTILKDLSTRQPDLDALRPKLRRLAEVLLCPRWHQDQAQDMVDQWAGRIKEAYPCSTTTDSQRATASSTATAMSGTNHRHVPISRSGTLTPTTASLSSTTEREAVEELIALMQETLRTAQRRLGELEEAEPSTLTPPSSTPTIPRIATSDIPSPALSRASTNNSTAATPVHQSRDVSPTSSRPCIERHVRRRAIDDECPICRQDFLLRDGLVWCRSSCGRTVHRACFEAWEAECRAGGRRATCVVCRADWESCGCDD